jgi:tagatose-1,6-bisphosphate aldolase non-catalytic subunit AgaZ/GatZ
MTTKYREMVAAATLTASPVSYYTAPGGTSAAIHAASITNPTGAVVTVNIYKVKTGGAAGAPTKIASKAVGPGATIAAPEVVNHKLEPGTQLFADGLACTLNISGIEFIPS